MSIGKQSLNPVGKRSMKSFRAFEVLTENAVIIYWPSCRSKHTQVTFFCGKQEISVVQNVFRRLSCQPQIIDKKNKQTLTKKVLKMKKGLQV